MILTLIVVLTALLGLASVLAFFKVPFGALRGLDFPRQQIFLCALALILVLPMMAPHPLRGYLLAILLIVCGIQLLNIVKFTPIWSKQSISATADQRQDTARQISVLAANVKLSNRAYDRLIDLIKRRNPDIVLAIEVDEEWIAALSGALNRTYTHQIDVPRTNGYGICVLSQLALSEVDVQEMITEGVPSVRTKVTLRDGSPVRLYVVHPEPPIIDHDTKGRDGEIAQIGIKAADDPLPAIVSGDLNDVAWSTTTRRFQRLSGLLDPRVGRGFYNTFSATMPWMRWPLDHLFHDPRFRLVEMARLGKIGSDHFPIWFVLALARTPAQASDPGTFDPAEKAEVKDMIEAEKKRDREAIGSDWETEDPDVR